MFFFVFVCIVQDDIVYDYEELDENYEEMEEPVEEVQLPISLERKFNDSVIDRLVTLAVYFFALQIVLFTDYIIYPFLKGG